MEKYCRAGQATDYNITRSMRFACWISKAADKHLEHVIFIDFSTATMVKRKALNPTLYVQCLSCKLGSIRSSYPWSRKE